MTPPAAPAPLLRALLLAWYDAARRDLPWRRTSDPYAIWVSEIMLQQTTVAVVIPYWERFVAAFPDLEALAGAPLERVLALWAGLGYYRRARLLHEAARTLVARGATGVPATLDGLRALPGVGAYTAAAIASIAFDIAEPVVDGNVQRVLAREGALAGDPARAECARLIHARARALLDPARPGDSNQALMELGATVCVPRAPRCLACPWSEHCAARALGAPERFPAAAPARETVIVVRAAAALRDRHARVLLRRVPEDQRNAGLWELPAAALPGARAETKWTGAQARLAQRELGELFERALVLGAPAGRVRHAITHHRITTWLLPCTLERAAPRGAAWAWSSIDDSHDMGLTGEARKLIRLLT